MDYVVKEVRYLAQEAAELQSRNEGKEEDIRSCMLRTAMKMKGEELDGMCLARMILSTKHEC